MQLPMSITHPSHCSSCPKELLYLFELKCPLWYMKISTVQKFTEPDIFTESHYPSFEDFWFLKNFLQNINIKYKDFMFIDANIFFTIVSNWFKTRYPYWQIARSMEYTPLQSNALRILLHSLSLNQSTSVLKNMFATQRALVTRVSGHSQNTENRHSGLVINASLVVDYYPTLNVHATFGYVFY